MPASISAAATHVLVVEDDPDLRESLCDVLRDEGYEAPSAAHGQEALEWLSANPAPSVILLDMMMPVMNGTELRERLREHERLRAIPVIVLSVLDLARQKVELAGASAYLKKPIDPDDLFETLSRVLAPAPTVS